MKVVVQNTDDRDVLGIVNALLIEGHEVAIWKPEEDDISQHADAGLAIFNDSARLGTKTLGVFKKQTKTMFIKCSPPEFFLNRKPLTIDKFPYCADVRRYPPVYFNKKFHCNILYISTFQHDESREEYISKIPQNLKFWIVGTPVEHPNYIGNAYTPSELSTFAMSADVCIDFGLEYGLDLAKIGCQVITNKENTIDIPTFNVDNLTEILIEEVKKPKPILNKYDKHIMTYQHFLTYIYQMLETQ